MNYPIWEVPAAGLLIAAVAVLHVFISHFAVGGGLFLVLLEGRAYRNEDPALLQFVKDHARFFVLITLVLGAVTGVGIWFTISLVHPQATSALIQIFVWFWATEWTFFLTEITAALVYYYGWDRLSPRNHLIVGWIYFGSAWLSLVTINGILTFMLTPGDWVVSGSVWDGFFNPTYWPSVLTRTLVAVALAGLYALFTASFLEQTRVKEQIIRYAGLRWLIPAVACLPLALYWYLMAAAADGIPVFEVLGSEKNSLVSALLSLRSRSDSVGIPLAHQAIWLTTISSLLILLTTGVAVRRRKIRPTTASVLLLLGLASFAGGEWIREDLRKPYVLGRQMFVNGVRLPSRRPMLVQEDPLSINTLNQRGVLRTALWRSKARRAEDEISQRLEDGRELFTFLCISCHTLDGHMGIKPLVQGQTVASLESLLGKLAQPVDEMGQETHWSSPQLSLRTWRGRRMPPFVGTATEKSSLARFLASLTETTQQTEFIGDGQNIFEEKCLFCHGKKANWPMEKIAAGKTAADFYDRIGRLPEINPIMPPFEDGDDKRRAVSQYLEMLVERADSKGEKP
jgi:mono/diheme cytochrome c family protein